MEEVRGTFNMLPQYNSENYSVQGMLNEIRAMNTFLFAINRRSARTYASSCGQTVVGGEDYSRICAPRGWCALCATMDRARTGRLCSIRSLSICSTCRALIRQNRACPISL